MLTDYCLRGLVTFVSPKDREYMFLFTATGWTGEIKECDEGTLEWVPMKNVPQLPIWEGDKIFFRLLETDGPFFSLKLVYGDGDRLQAAFVDGSPFPLS